MKEFEKESLELVESIKKRLDDYQKNTPGDSLSLATLLMDQTARLMAAVASVTGGVPVLESEIEIVRRMGLQYLELLKFNDMEKGKGGNA
jgi:hypothetical protein